MRGKKKGEYRWKGEKMKFAGRWHIYEMDLWDEEYFNAEVPAYIQIDTDGTGEFQFGYMSGGLDGKIVKYPNEERFEFSWSGSDEMDPVNGCGWVRIKDDGDIEGEFRIYLGDDSGFLARKV